MFVECAQVRVTSSNSAATRERREIINTHLPKVNVVIAIILQTLYSSLFLLHSFVSVWTGAVNGLCFFLVTHSSILSVWFGCCHYIWCLLFWINSQNITCGLHVFGLHNKYEILLNAARQLDSYRVLYGSCQCTKKHLPCKWVAWKTVMGGDACCKRQTCCDLLPNGDFD